MKAYLTILFVIFYFSAISQNKFIISGKIKDSETLKPITGVSILINGTKLGTTSNEDGFYNLKVVKGKKTIIVNHIGFKIQQRKINVFNDTIINFTIVKDVIAIDEVSVKGEREDENVSGVQTGIVKLTSKEVNKLPKFLGEADLIKTIKLTPGIQTTGEVSSGLHVRGGGAGQNLITLDDMPLYNPSHLLGLFSVFNSDVINNVKLIKGGMPANYGGRASSVLEINLKEGSKDKTSVAGSIGLISSKITAESPINKGKGSIVVGARRTFLGLFQTIGKSFLKKSNKFINDTRYYFYDFNAKISYNITPKDIVFITAYTGQDYYSLDRSDIDFSNKMIWGNSAISLRWNHIVNSHFSYDNVIGYTDFKFDLSSAFEDVTFNLYSKINDWFYKLNFNYLGYEKHKIKYGAQYTKHKLIPNKITASATDFDYGTFTQYYSHEVSAYFNDEYVYNDKLSFQLGLRYNKFFFTGPFEKYVLNPITFQTDTTSYSKNTIIESFGNPEIRASVRYSLNESSSLKSSFSSNVQYIHLASIGSVSLPTDIWLPSTDLIQPERVNQYTLGYFRNFKENTYESSVEVYYKSMQNQLKFKTGFLSSFDSNDLKENLVFGDGKSYGVEMFIKKNKGITRGWISYTLSKTTLQFPELASGEPFFAKYDQRHNLSVVLMHDLNKKWSVSSVFVYTTGNALTLPVGRYIFQGNVLNEYMGINSFRMPAYHRLDISFSYTPEKVRRYESSWNFGVYNVYNRENPYYIFFNIEGNIDEYYLNVEAKEVSLFPIIPYLSWTFKF